MGPLAFAANVPAQSASAHLAKLVEGGLLMTEAAHLIKSLASFGAAQPAACVPPVAPLARALSSQFLHARTCCDQLAGETAVQLLHALLKAGWLVEDGAEYTPTELGRERLTTLGVDLDHDGKKWPPCIGAGLRRSDPTPLASGRPPGRRAAGAFCARGLGVPPKGQQAFAHLFGNRAH